MPENLPSPNEMSIDLKKQNRKIMNAMSYQPPEHIHGRVKDFSKLDAYAFGMLAWEVFAQRKPFAEPKYYSMNTYEKAAFITSGTKLDMPEGIPPAVSNVITKCWDLKADNRPPFSEIVKVFQFIYATASDKVPPPIPKMPRGQNLADLAWSGEISRDKVEVLLKNKPEGTFLTRWSTTTCCYVLSYVSNNKIQHLGGIEAKEDHSVAVQTLNAGIVRYANLTAYIEHMKNKKPAVITHPVIIRDGNHYGTMQSSVNIL